MMDIQGMNRIALRALSFILLVGVAACAESSADFRRNVEIRTDGPPAQCMLTNGRTSVAIDSTPGTVLLPYSVTAATVECRNRNGWHGATSVDLPNWRRAQTVVIPMHR